MTGVSRAQRERIDGLAAFAGIGFALAFGLIYALERVGAPDALVEALGPLFALLTLSVIGVTARSPNLPDFLAARRLIPALYGGLAFAATAAGLVAAMALAPGGAEGPPWRGMGAGLILAALIVAPRWRGENASALGDVLATHYPAGPTRIVFTLLLAVIGALTAIAGFDLATDALAASFGATPRLARAVTMLAVVVSLVPGGLKGLLWSDAASGGGALLIGIIGAGLATLQTPAPLAPLQSGWQAALGGPIGGSLGRETAVAIAIAFFFALTSPGFGAGSRSQARRAGLAGLALLALGIGLAMISLPFLEHAAEASRTAAALAGAAAWLPALALARAGVFGTARATGIDLATAFAQLNVLSSTRIALIRLGVLIVIGLAPFASAALRVDTASALYLALGLGLALVTPSLLLALALPVTTLSALSAFGVALVVAAARGVETEALPIGPDLLLDAMIAGIAGLVIGAVATLMFPADRGPARPLSDPFADLPLEPPG